MLYFVQSGLVGLSGMHCMCGAVSVARFVGMVGMVWYCMFYCLSGTYGMVWYFGCGYGMALGMVRYCFERLALHFALYSILRCICCMCEVWYGTYSVLFCKVWCLLYYVVGTVCCCGHGMVLYAIVWSSG